MTGEGQPGSVGQGGEVGVTFVLRCALRSPLSYLEVLMGPGRGGPPGSDIGLGLTITYLVFA